MNGFEYQVAAHMIYEDEAGGETRREGARHHPSRTRTLRCGKNAIPSTRFECSDHYARSMASYGVFLAACGFEYDGPAGHIGFAPRLSPNNFRTPFTASEGWGVYNQRIKNQALTASLHVDWGKLTLQTISIYIPKDAQVSSVTVGGNQQEFQTQ